MRGLGGRLIGAIKIVVDESKIISEPAPELHEGKKRHLRDYKGTCQTAVLELRWKWTRALGVGVADKQADRKENAKPSSSSAALQ